MNITPSTIYWISVLDSMLGVAVLLAILSGFAVVILAVINAGEDEDGPTLIKKTLALSASVFVASIVTCIFTPSAKTCAAMYVVPAIANSEKLQGVTDGIYELALEWLKDLKPSKANGEKAEVK
jgi:hypothetical protein